MSPHTATSTRTSATSFSGPLVWRKVVDKLCADGVISKDEAQRTIARCSRAESAQNPLVRLANVAMARVSDGRPLDILRPDRGYLAKRAGLPYLRIDPLKVDVGRGRHHDASYAERHRCCPCRSPPKWWWPRPAFITRLVKAGQASSRTVTRVDHYRYHQRFTARFLTQPSVRSPSAVETRITIAAVSLLRNWARINVPALLPMTGRAIKVVVPCQHRL